MSSMAEVAEGTREAGGRASKVLANASKHSAVSYGHAGRSVAELELEVGELMRCAEQADSAPRDDGLDIPAENRAAAKAAGGFAQSARDHR